MPEIAEWLSVLGMSEYTQRFAENRIDLSILPDLTDQDLRDLGIVLGDRRKILRAIGELGKAPAPVEAPPVSTPSATPSVFDAPEASAEHRIASLRVLLLVTFRQEFAPPWIGQSHVTALTLNRLPKRDIDALIDGVVGNKPLPVSIRQDIIERTDGIPLFAEEMTKAVLEAESESEAQQTAAPSPALAVPASLHASLMARLDRLGGARELARIGAAIGRAFSHELLDALALKPETELNLWPRTSRCCRVAVPARRAAVCELLVQARPGPGRGLQYAVARAPPSTPRPYCSDNRKPHPEAALADANFAVNDAREIGHTATYFMALFFGSLAHIFRGDYAIANALIDEGVALAEEKAALAWKLFAAPLWRGLLFAVMDKSSEAVQPLMTGLSVGRSGETRIHFPFFLPHLAMAHAKLGKLDDAWRCIDEATTLIGSTKERWCEAEVYRVAGEVALLQRDTAKAKEHFERALTIARNQQAKSWELRAAMARSGQAG